MGGRKKYYKCSNCDYQTFKTKRKVDLKPHDFTCSRCGQKKGLKQIKEPQERSPEEKKCFRQIIEVYHDFLKRELDMKPDFGPQDFKAVYDIIDYIKRSKPDNSYDDVVTGWKLLLSKEAYEYWDDFYKKQIKLYQIRKNLVNIISSFKTNYDRISKKRESRTSQFERKIQGNRQSANF